MPKSKPMPKSKENPELVLLCNTCIGIAYCNPFAIASGLQECKCINCSFDPVTVETAKLKQSAK